MPYILNLSSTADWNLVRFSSPGHWGFYAEMFIGSIDKLYHEMTSYKTRHSSYSNPTGCMPGTRVKILAKLGAWASDDLSSTAGKLTMTVLHTLCEILDGKNMLGDSFFYSRGSENTRNAHRPYNCSFPGSCIASG
jgi:hypothetical protein